MVPNEIPPRGATGNTSKLKEGLINTSLVLGSLIVFYLIAELIFFRLLLPHVSLYLRPHLPDRADFFLQKSKAGYVPHDYIALVGDSYAQGMGDWLLSIGGKSDLPYHSADVLHELLGNDVASFGRAAAGSAEAMVLRVTRIYGDADCYLFPPVEKPKHFLIYFYEGNDIDDNYRLLQHDIRLAGADIRPSIDKFLDNEYGLVSSWRCHGHFGDMIFRLTRFVIRDYFADHHVIDLPPVNRIMIAGVPTGTPELQVPSVGLDDTAMGAGFVVYERSLAWFRRKFPDVPTTVVYIPSPASLYRHAESEVIAKDVYLPAMNQARIGHPVVIDGPRFAVSAIYANSQKVCEKIRKMSLDQGTEFIDPRPILRKAAAERPLHGPRDWNHFNETGYRLLGTLLAARIGEHPTDACDDRWD